MDIFDKIAKNASDVAKAAGKKAEGIANTAKIKFALANLQSDLDELYEKLGRLYYNTMTGGNADEHSEGVLIGKITTVKADMEILKAELAAAKNENICASCGKNVEKELSFCPYCGCKLK